MDCIFDFCRCSLDFGSENFQTGLFNAMVGGIHAEYSTYFGTLGLNGSDGLLSKY